MSRAPKLKKTLVEQILDKAGVAHEAISVDFLTPEERASIPQDQIFKTLALTGDKTGPVIGIVPLTAQLSEKKLAKLSGNKKVAMVAQKDLQKTTGYVHGANNPVGIRQKHAYPIFLDQSALELGEMIVSAGEVGRSIKLKAQDLADFVGASFADLKEDK